MIKIRNVSFETSEIIIEKIKDMGLTKKIKEIDEFITSSIFVDIGMFDKLSCDINGVEVELKDYVVFSVNYLGCDKFNYTLYCGRDIYELERATKLPLSLTLFWEESF